MGAVFTTNPCGNFHYFSFVDEKNVKFRSSDSNCIALTMARRVSVHRTVGRKAQGVFREVDPSLQ